MIDWDHSQPHSAFQDWESFCSDPARGVTVDTRYEDVPPDFPPLIRTTIERLRRYVPDDTISRPFNGRKYYLRRVRPALRHPDTARPGCELVFGPSDYRGFLATCGMEARWAARVLDPDEWTTTSDWVSRWTRGRSRGQVSPFFCHGLGVNALVTIPAPGGGRMGLFAERPPEGEGSGFVAVSAGVTVATVDEGLRMGRDFDESGADNPAPDLDRALRRALDEELGYRKDWPLRQYTLLDVGLVTSVHQAAALYHVSLDVSWEQICRWTSHAQDFEMEVGTPPEHEMPRLWRVPMTQVGLSEFFEKQARREHRVCSWVAVLAQKIIGPQPPRPPEQERRFDVGLSFAREDRSHAETMRNLLVGAGYRVFYDMDFEEELWGADLYSELARIYEKDCDYCVVFVSDHYKRRPWCNVELKAALSRLFRERSRYVLPIRIDDTELDGVPNTMGYQDLRIKNLEEIADVLLRVLSRSRKLR